MFRSLSLSVLVFCVSAVASQNDESSDSFSLRPTQKLDHQKQIFSNLILQKAGLLGSFSIGVGFDWEKFRTSFHYGRSKNDIGPLVEQYSAKVLHTPWRALQLKDVNWRVFYYGIFLSYTDNKNYFLKLPDHYPEDYYSQTAIRPGLILGTEFRVPIVEFNKQIVVFYELVSTDYRLIAFYNESERLGFSEVFSSGAGVRVFW